ncbi:MAG TPA: CoB--CoM heterodisulfide reductase iron-sulfur subunit A family protein [Candidatus Caldiarchaeum subterraneum]|uniref:CoB--CoM heterodisulfide reductase iron-sulfur subunit A family protein n=1 Tax=Caldiarchaeum subterraneum TaxID=311458 RepID=A0A832ZW99_CALS0|nr:CoB--CoM heterodisulfide reductase iron-sulfur subunit A family protein [Candidatus Caldarchaeum subterraneum]
MRTENPVLIIGGGPAGLRAAVDLSEMGIEVILVEKRNELGGAPVRWKYKTLAPMMRPTEEVMNPLIEHVEKSELVKVYKNSIVEEAKGNAGNFVIRIKNGLDNRVESLNVSAIIVATGFEHFDARIDPRYGYGKNPNVIGIHELEAMLKSGRVVKHDGQPPERIAFIFCVGSRDRATNPWCCTVCCGVSIKQAIELKEILPDSQIYMIYMDVRTFGLWEKLYWKSMEEYGINYIRGRVSEIYYTGEKLLVKGEDTLVRGPFEVLFDMVVLAVGMEPGQGTKQVAKALDLAINEFGFLEPKHPNIHHDSSKEGIFLAGACVAPMSVEEAIAEGSAAAMQVVKLLHRLAKPIEAR